MATTTGGIFVCATIVVADVVGWLIRCYLMVVVAMVVNATATLTSTATVQLFLLSNCGNHCNNKQV